MIANCKHCGWIAGVVLTLVAACNPQPSVTQVGDLTPSQRIEMPEFETTALGAPWSQTKCGNPAGVSELFLAGGSSLIRVRSDQLGSLGTSSQGITFPNPSFNCSGSPTSTLNRTFDANISRLPDGRILYVELTKTEGPGPPCPSELPRALLMAQSFNCGSSWGKKILSATDIDPNYPWIDRPSLFVDVTQQTMYLAFQMRSMITGGGISRTVLLRDSTNDATLAWSKVLSTTSFTGGVTAMAARQDDNDEALMLFQCSNGRPQLLRVENPATSDGLARTHEVTVDVPKNTLPNCYVVGGPLSASQIKHVLPQLSIAPLAGGAVDEFRLVYPDRVIANGEFYQTVHVVDISLDLATSPIKASILRQRVLDYSVRQQHVLYPDLVSSEGFETTSGLRYQHVLTYTLLNDSGAETVQTEIWRNVIEGWLPPIIVQNRSTILSPYMREVAGGQRFFGDYKEGTFLDDDGTRARFFVPWNLTRVGQGTPNVKVHGAVVEP